MGQVFQITAWTLSGSPVTSFDNSFFLTIEYDDLPLGSSAPPVLYFWQESDGVWVEVPTIHNSASRTLTAILDHLTIFAAMQRDDHRVYIPMLTR